MDSRLRGKDKFENMKTDLHPTYHKEATFKCACGSEFKVGSTIENFETELCNNCHPFYTGKQKIVDTARRVEKFTKKMEGKAAKVVSKKQKKAKVRAKKEERGAKSEPASK